MKFLITVNLLASTVRSRAATKKNDTQFSQLQPLLKFCKIRCTSKQQTYIKEEIKTKSTGKKIIFLRNVTIIQI